MKNKCLPVWPIPGSGIMREALVPDIVVVQDTLYEVSNYCESD